MTYYAAILELIDAEKNKTFRPQHLAYLRKCKEEDTLFACGPFTNGSGGLVIYQAESQEQAQKLAESDPYVIEGARKLVLKEWKMTQNPAELG